LTQKSQDMNLIDILWSCTKINMAEKQPCRAKKACKCNRTSLGERNQFRALCVPSKKHALSSWRSGVKKGRHTKH